MSSFLSVCSTINGTLPGPILRFKEGDEAILRVTNNLDEDTSIHWHGILLPNGMDGVPNVKVPGMGIDLRLGPLNRAHTMPFVIHAHIRHGEQRARTHLAASVGPS